MGTNVEMTRKIRNGALFCSCEYESAVMSVITELSGEPSSPGMQSLRRRGDNSDRVALKSKGCGVKVLFGGKGGGSVVIAARPFRGGT